MPDKSIPCGHSTIPTIHRKGQLPAAAYILRRAGLLIFDMSKKRSYLACVSVQYGSDYIIETARCIAEDDCKARLSVVSVLTELPTQEELEALEHLNDIARSSCAPMTVLYSENPVLAVVDHIKHNKITHVVAGMPCADVGDGKFIDLLRAVLPKVNILVIPKPVAVPTDNNYRTDYPFGAFGD